MRGLTTLARFAALFGVAGYAIYAAYLNVSDEATMADEMKHRYMLTWGMLPVIVLFIYFATVAASGGTRLSFRPALSLLVAYSIVYSIYAFNGPTNATRGGRTQFFFIPLILGVFSLPFVLFMLDRIFNLVRDRLRGKKSNGEGPPQNRPDLRLHEK